MNRRAFSFSILSTCLAATSFSLSFGQENQVADKDVFEGINWRDIKCWRREGGIGSTWIENLVETEQEFFYAFRKYPSLYLGFKSFYTIAWEPNLQEKVKTATNFLFDSHWQKFGSNSHLGQDDLKTVYYEKILNKYFPDLNNKQS